MLIFCWEFLQLYSPMILVCSFFCGVLFWISYKDSAGLTECIWKFSLFLTFLEEFQNIVLIFLLMFGINLFLCFYAFSISASWTKLHRPRQSHNPCLLFSPRASSHNPAARPVTRTSETDPQPDHFSSPSPSLITLQLYWNLFVFLWFSFLFWDLHICCSFWLEYSSLKYNFIVCKASFYGLNVCILSKFKCWTLTLSVMM